MLHVANDPISCFAERAFKQWIWPKSQGIGEETHEPPVVVLHLLEVGDHPFDVGRVSTKTSPHVIVDAATTHSIKSCFHYFKGLRIMGSMVHPQKDLKTHARWEFWRLAKAAKLRINVGDKLIIGRPKNFLGEWR